MIDSSTMPNATVYDKRFGTGTLLTWDGELRKFALVQFNDSIRSIPRKNLRLPD